MADERDLRPVGTLTMDELFAEISARSPAALLCVVAGDNGGKSTPCYLHGAKIVLLGMARVIDHCVEKSCLDDLDITP